jgi:hypothetical protein
MAFERAKKVGKKIVAYPEDRPSVLSSKDWINNLVQDPKGYVSQTPPTVPSFPFNSIVNRSSII